MAKCRLILGVGLMALIWFAVTPPPASALAFTYTDTGAGGAGGSSGYSITYDFNYTFNSIANRYEGSMAVTETNSTGLSGVYLDEIVFKPENGSSLASFALDSPTLPNWSVYTENGGFYGAAITGYTGKGDTNYANGIDLSNPFSQTNVFSFNFTLANNDTLQTGPPLKAQYNGPQLPNGNLQFGQLSVNASPTGNVPEPATLLLLGFGVLVLLACERKFRKA